MDWSVFALFTCTPPWLRLAGFFVSGSLGESDVTEGDVGSLWVRSGIPVGGFGCPAEALVSAAAGAPRPRVRASVAGCLETPAGCRGNSVFGRSGTPVASCDSAVPRRGCPTNAPIGFPAGLPPRTARSPRPGWIGISIPTCPGIVSSAVADSSGTVCGVGCVGPGGFVPMEKPWTEYVARSSFSPEDSACLEKCTEAIRLDCCGARLRPLPRLTEAASSLVAGRRPPGSVSSNKPIRSKGNGDCPALASGSSPAWDVPFPDADGSAAGSCGARHSRRDVPGGSAITEGSIADRSPNRARSFSMG
jgi:hypothetical protein